MAVWMGEGVFSMEEIIVCLSIDGKDLERELKK